MKYNEKYKILIYLICVLFIFTIGYINNHSIDQYYYDSGLYYQLSTSFVKNGYFSFTNFDLSKRGYLFPFIIFIYTKIGSLFNVIPGVCILMGNSMFISFLFLIILPDFFRDSKKNNIIRMLFPIIIFMLYWSDLIYYPLSDVYSFGMIIMAIWLLIRVDFKYNIKSILFSVISGILIYAAYNIRTIYLFSIPFIIIIFLLKHKKDNYKKMTIFLAAFLTGIIICSIPQININDNYYDKKFMGVYTESLFEFQLYNGLFVQRYETYVGDPIYYSSPGVRFIDDIGKNILEKEQLYYGKNFDVLSYTKLALKYPMDFVGIMARHFINIFHLPYNHAYIKDLNYHTLFFTVLNYTIIFIAGIGAILFRRKKDHTIKSSYDMLYLFVTLIPCIAILPGAIEMRFFMPLYVILYYFIAYKISYKDAFSYIRVNKIGTIITFLLLLALLTAVWGNTFNNAELLPLLLG